MAISFQDLWSQHSYVPQKIMLSKMAMQNLMKVATETEKKFIEVNTLLYEDVDVEEEPPLWDQI